MSDKFATAMVAVIYLLSMLFGIALGQTSKYSTILEALQGQNLTGFESYLNQSAAASSGSEFSFLTDPNFQGVVLAPATETLTIFNGFLAARNATASNQSWSNVVLYHVAPIPGDYPTIEPNQIYNSLLPTTANVTGTWTVLPNGTDTLLIGGIDDTDGQVFVNTNKNVSAAKATIYLVDTILIPPQNPTMINFTLPLSLNAYLEGMGNFSKLLTLANGANATGLLNSPDTMITLFAPGDNAFQNIDLTSMSANDTNNLMYTHILPRPTTRALFSLISQLPNSSASLLTYKNPSDNITITLPAGYPNVSGPVTVQGAGNDHPVNVTRVDLAGKSIVYQLDGVLLPAK